MKQALCVFAISLALALPGVAAAQVPRPGAPAQPPPFAQGENNDQPIEITAATLDIRDKDKMATFAGDVVVVQGDTTIKCQKLKVFYGAERGAGRQKVASTGSAKAAPGAQPAQGGQGAQGGAQGGAQQQGGATMMPQRTQDIRRIEASGGVTVISKDQNASGDLGIYDPKKKTITLTGNVVVSQGKNVLHGDRVVVDTVTGNAQFNSGSPATQAGPAGPASAPTQNRVRALILPSKDPNAPPGAPGPAGPSTLFSVGPQKTN